MSGQYPSGFNSPAGFGNQMNNSMGNQMRNQQMNMGMGMPNQMGMMNTQMNFNQPGIMQQSQQPQPPQSQPMQSPNMGLGATGLSHGSEMGQIAHVSPQHQMQQQVNQQQSMCLQTPTTANAGNASNMINNLVPQVPGSVAQSQSQNQHPHQKEFNIVSLCRFGQETVQDISSRFQEVFAALKSVQPPSINNPSHTATEKKITEQFRTIRLLFKRLRLLFDKCNDSCQQDLGMEYTHIESLIPLKDEPDHKSDPAPSEEFKKHIQENRELTEAVMMKNKQLREIIDRIRIIIWEINTMLSMRRS
ncbi:Mediator of RNA polymerase II transcription subunit 30 [Pseudolycoriella hygida]|uniref:Mediator of RNA polymerase II transcription subunit 30 n=1 Tax=Pseudolycoriella hygida TaxID=35572 RepID=A0A9Q0N5P2_9DIPT|nr:Mediator of RNA polymerase II transcription subunit 30 [Pseudolycoriella hygida]